MAQGCACVCVCVGEGYMCMCDFLGRIGKALERFSHFYFYILFAIFLFLEIMLNDIILYEKFYTPDLIWYNNSFKNIVRWSWKNNCFLLLFFKSLPVHNLTEEWFKIVVHIWYCRNPLAVEDVLIGFELIEQYQKLRSNLWCQSYYKTLYSQVFPIGQMSCKVFPLCPWPQQTHCHFWLCTDSFPEAAVPAAFWHRAMGCRAARAQHIAAAGKWGQCRMQEESGS